MCCFRRIRPIMNQLAQHGHNITALSVNTDPNAVENITYIHLENTYNVLYGDGKANNNILKRSEENPFQATMSFYKFGTLGCIGNVCCYMLLKKKYLKNNLPNRSNELSRPPKAHGVSR